MSIHLYTEEKLSDEHFYDGRLDFLFVGNICRRLDGRRTSGKIIDIFESCGMFRFEITEYEDKGSFWDIPFEDVSKFQFAKESVFLEADEIERYERIVEKFDKSLVVEPSEIERSMTERMIDEAVIFVEKWLEEKVNYSYRSINLGSDRGLEKVSGLLKAFMKDLDLLDIEEKTAGQMVLNPNSGEWIKAMCITMAEMGLTHYDGKVMRDLSVYGDFGSVANRKRYVVFRLAFVRVIFSKLRYDDVILYRGMSSEGEWVERNRALMSMTFSKKVAEAFSDLSIDSKYKSSYVIKMTLPVDRLFMTFIETGEMNNQYRESEAIIYGDLKFSI